MLRAETEALDTAHREAESKQEELLAKAQGKRVTTSEL